MKLSSGVITSEFWMALAALAGKVITLLVVLQVIHTTDPNNLTQAISSVILGIGTIWGLAKTNSTYTNNRTELKVEAMKSEAQQVPRTPGTTILTP